MSGTPSPAMGTLIPTWEALMPAAKKHSSVRARANRASTAATLTNDAKATIVRALPETRSWHDLTRQWWVDLWGSPMSAEYHQSDWYQLILLATAYDMLLDPELSPGQFKVLSEEVRAHRTPFGLTPYDRRRLEWTIEQAEESKDRGKSRRERQGSVQPSKANDPRSALHAVS